MTGIYLAGRQRRRYVLSASILAITTFSANTVAAQCTPDPTQPNRTTICDGVQDGGLVVGSNRSGVTIEEDGAIRSSGGPALLIARATAPSDQNETTITVNGDILGIGQTGVEFRTGAAFRTASTSETLRLTVGRAGTIVGSTGLALTGSVSNPYGFKQLVVDNAGTISGTDGYAIHVARNSVDGEDYVDSYLDILNRADGTIGAISGTFASLTNLGRIDGGLNSAVDGRSIDDIGPSATLRNEGVITAQGSAATITGMGYHYSLENIGTISNAGTGPAIEGGFIVLDNGSGGVIDGGGGVAIRAANGITLTNAGTIEGDVVIQTPPAMYMPNSVVDSTRGTINGNLILGAGHDLLVATFAGDRLVTGVTGRIDGGAGNDGIQLEVNEDSRIGSAVALPGFEYLRITAAADVTATLVDGFASTGPLSLSGSGSIVNDAALTANGYLAISASSYDGGLKFTNRGTITGASGSVQYASNHAISLYSLTFDNSGLIDIAGDAVRVSSRVTFSNSGTISGSRNAVAVDSGSITNDGLIRSTAGIGLDLSYGARAENRGTISGEIFGVRQSGSTLINSGTISSPGVAIAGSSGAVFNQAGGVITGGTLAIGSDTPSQLIVATTIANAGIINGNVVLGSASQRGTDNIYVALSGGVLNGDLTLGSGSLLVTGLPSDGATGFAGINGAVVANGAALLYRTDSDAAATIAPVAGFGAVSYEVADGATLTLHAETRQSQGLTLGGTGHVDLDADFAIVDGTAIRVVAPTRLPGMSYSDSALSIVSHGAITVRGGNVVDYPEYGAGIFLGDADDFDNRGSITGRFRSEFGYMAPLISGGGTVINRGTIRLDGMTAISGAGAVENSGTIAGVNDDVRSAGIEARTIVNSGTIRVSDTAIVADYSPTVTNSGTIASLSGVAILGRGSVRLDNAAGATISGGNGTAIAVHGGTIVNAGSIIGTVNMRNQSGAYARSVYEARGGTIQGDLLFGGGADLFIQNGETTGVSGIVDGGGGRDIFVRDYSRNTIVSVDAPIRGAINFETLVARPIGADTVVTLIADRAIAGPVYVAGTGHIVNRVTAGRLTSAASILGTTIVDGILASVTNEADVGGVWLHTHRLANSATIRGDAGQYAATIYALGSLSLDNSGSILAGEDAGRLAAVLLSGAELTEFSAGNSGLVDGGLSAILDFAAAPQSGIAHVQNSGVIRNGATGVSLMIATPESLSAMTIENEGSIEANTFGIAISAPGNDLAPERTAGPISITNSGTIRALGDGIQRDVRNPDGSFSSVFQPASAISNALNADLIVSNAAGGTIAAQGDDAAAIITYQGSLTLTNEGIIVGSIDLGAGADRIENYGSIAGNVWLRDGDDRFTQSIGATIDGVVDGGEGADTLIVDVTGGGTHRGNGFTGFEHFRQIGDGIAHYAGASAFETVTVSGGTLRLEAGDRFSATGLFAIDGGRVAGAAGSVMTAPRFAVASGAVFGSAGIVNGDVAVAGTLSPGASPGTMTINGNVMLAGGSTTAFELTPTISDAIVINGSLSIASGATLTLDGNRPLTAGLTYDLITASDGITGGFTTIDKAASVFGIVLQTEDSIRLLGKFVLRPGANAQAVRITDYINGLLEANLASSALIEAISGSLDGEGYAVSATMRRLSPEAYASATQIGIENGLALATTARAMTLAGGRDSAGAFTFGQAFGNWRNLPGRFADGTARADVSTHGVLGGIGFGSDTASAGLFVGYVDASQRITEIGARTDADGVIAGITGRLSLGSLDVAAMVAWDGSKADTSRALPGQTETGGHYSLRSLTYDVSIGHAFGLSGGWTVRPEIGATHIASRRGGITETDGGVFDLVVDRGRSKATFVSGALTLTGDASARLQPWFSAGARHQTSGRTPFATARLGSVDQGFSVAGAARDATQATIGAGVNARLSNGLMLFAHVGSEFGADSNGQNAGVGLRVRF